MQIGATAHPRSTAAAAENVTEHIAENIAERAGAGATAASGGRVNTGVTELIIGCAFLSVAQHFIGFFDFLEAHFRLGVTRVAIRMVFHRQTAIGFFQVGVTRSVRNAQYFVIVAFGHGFSADNRSQVHICPRRLNIPVSARHVSLFAKAPLAQAGAEAPAHSVDHGNGDPSIGPPPHSFGQHDAAHHVITAMQRLDAAAVVSARLIRP